MTTNVFDFIIYTDGSANSSCTGGSACIVENTNTLQRYHLLTSYLPSTNNQAEVFATLIGYSFIESISKDIPWNTRVKVVSDSEYVLGCSTHYVASWIKSGKLYNLNVPLKNRGFWQLFVKLTSDMTLTREHVKGHTGHYDNERCDNAASWARKERAENLVFKKNQTVELIKRKRKAKMFTDNWFYFDCEPVFKLIRDEATLDIDKAVTTLSSSVQAYSGKTDTNTTQDRILKAMIDRVKEAITMANGHKSQDERISQLEKVLMDVVGEYKDENY